ncbi:allophanate hydrolase subunit 2-domain-containing protein [Mycena vitilis]|nr:allophanate hydrolase subunit 2-domain-containing protein [Mycena vitilis]
MHKLLVANRGEIALRIIGTAKAEGLATVAIYTSSDALSPHVTLADEAIFLAPQCETESEAQVYLSGARVITVCKERAATMLHPGYGFLAEDAAFAQAVLEAGIIWLGPTPEVIRTMGLKHLARDVAMEAGVVCVPGSTGLVLDAVAAVRIAACIGYPVMLKASAGGGGMGMMICADEKALTDGFASVTQRAEALFHNSGVFLERYFPSARHIEIQIFGNGQGDIVCMGERECSIQRRHQKIIEETPSPFLITRPGKSIEQLRARMCEAATRLGSFVRYSSAGTVEFLVDNDTGEFFFLEMNTRIQVEHPITEAVYPGLDLVKMMVQQGIAMSNGLSGLEPESFEMRQATYNAMLEEGLALGSNYAMEVRVYAENPAAGFRPCPGVLQHVDIPMAKYQWLRVETWISTGTAITPYFDPLLAKLVVSGPSRHAVLSRLQRVLEETHIRGATNNIEYLKAILDSQTFQAGDTTTKFLNSFEYCPCSMTILSAAVDMTIQDFPGRKTRMGIPCSGPMDSMAFRAANILTSNSSGMEGLEMIVLPGASATFRFQVSAVVAVTGKDVHVKLDDQETRMWGSIIVPAGAKLSLSAKHGDSPGLRTYLAVRGGFPLIPEYLGSKSTSVGLGGFQGRALIAEDEIGLAKGCQPTDDDFTSPRSVPSQFIPTYPSHLVVHVLAGPHDDEVFVTSAGISRFYATRWRISPSSNRLGIRLDSPGKILWARENGGAGGSHPSNILDNGYALGTINVNGDTPVILTNEAPDMGGYLCFCTVASAELWKVGQLSAGCTVEFRRIPWDYAIALHNRNKTWLEHIQNPARSDGAVQLNSILADNPQDPKLMVVPSLEFSPVVVLRQAGDSAILVEYGEMKLDFTLRVRVHALETILKHRSIPGLEAFSPCIRSTMLHFDPFIVSQSDVLAAIMDALRAIPKSMDEMTFPGRRLTFPIVLDDRWSLDALVRYMSSIRNKAVYLPSNVDYLARNNGFHSSEAVLAKLVASDWLVFGVGFYLACPFLVPIDPRCRLVAQKMNPSRTYTPRGAVGIAGVVAAIYPIVSPGGYMMYGRTLPAWQQWGKGVDFTPDRPWLLQPFDQVRFEPVTESQLLEIEIEFDSGRYAFEVEETIFSMADYSAFTASIADEVAVFEAKQRRGVEEQEIKEKELLAQWEAEKQTHGGDDSTEEAVEGGAQITSPMYGTVWKICCRPGDIIISGDMTVVILEAMKTEIPVKAGDRNVDRTVVGFGQGIREGASVNPGDVLVISK